MELHIEIQGFLSEHLHKKLHCHALNVQFRREVVNLPREVAETGGKNRGIRAGIRFASLRWSDTTYVLSHDFSKEKEDCN